MPVIHLTVFHSTALEPLRKTRQRAVSPFIKQESVQNQASWRNRTMPPLASRMPAPRAEKPLSFVAPLLGSLQYKEPVAFSLPPAMASPPRLLISVFHYASEGKWNPGGQIPWTGGAILLMS